MTGLRSEVAVRGELASPKSFPRLIHNKMTEMNKKHTPEHSLGQFDKHNLITLSGIFCEPGNAQRKITQILRQINCAAGDNKKQVVSCHAKCSLHLLNKACNSLSKASAYGSIPIV